ncbi:MAG TPA: CaiB/BaiF CoA-transferase family protein [Acidimicrobiia bacterium]|jgi:alpha-methylacyl-CoA racemase|nr:CaiB/BaiF CoA-transferase family protein [Acidimicrobiia bacterium]
MGPLSGVRVIEMAGIGPGPFCGMVLSGLGVEMVRVDRRDAEPMLDDPVTLRGRRSIALDLHSPEAVEVVLRLVETADGLIEGFRPGVMERMGLGPGECLGRNPRLVYGRITGWGQDGPLAASAGHDITYLAVAGGLHPIGRSGEVPVPPLNLVADYGGGGMLLALGMVAALYEAQRSGTGQVVDAAMVDGVAQLTALFHGGLAAGWWRPERGSNLLDGAAPFYDTYLTSDNESVALGALEPKFYAALVERLGLDPAALPPQYDRERWPELRARLAEVIATKTRDDWAAELEGTDSCAAGVLSLAEAPAHPHNVARASFIEVGGVVQPAPAPRFSATPTGKPSPPPAPGANTDAVLFELGYTPSEISNLRRSGVVG